MKTILDAIVDNKKKEIELLKKNYSYSFFEKQENFSRECISLSKELSKHDFGIIAEVKRKSPSAGVINSEIDVIKQGELYSKSGVSGISCLTDHKYFGGSINDLTELRSAVKVPILRKEFIIDEIQLFEAKAAGADALLLIAEILTKEEALHLTIMAQSLGMEVIMECHDKKNLEKINDLVDIIGVNNRNLHLQITDIQTSLDLFNYIPSGRVCISESGIQNFDQIFELQKAGFNGALIGESILKNNSPSEFISSLTLNQGVRC